MQGCFDIIFQFKYWIMCIFHQGAPLFRRGDWIFRCIGIRCGIFLRFLSIGEGDLGTRGGRGGYFYLCVHVAFSRLMYVFISSFIRFDMIWLT